MSTKFQQGLADRIQIKKKPPLWIAWVLLILIGVGIYLSPSQWYWGIGFTLFFLFIFRLRMYTWKMAHESFELAVFILPTLVMIGALIYLYIQSQLNIGVGLQILDSAPFSIVFLRNRFADQINEIARDVSIRFNPK